MDQAAGSSTDWKGWDRLCVPDSHLTRTCHAHFLLPDLAPHSTFLHIIHNSSSPFTETSKDEDVVNGSSQQARLGIRARDQMEPSLPGLLIPLNGNGTVTVFSLLRLRWSSFFHFFFDLSFSTALRLPTLKGSGLLALVASAQCLQ